MLQWENSGSPSRDPNALPQLNIPGRDRSGSESDEKTIAESLHTSTSHPQTSNPFGFHRRRNTKLKVDDYFQGPRDIVKHSKWPVFLQMHGSIMPKMLIPMIIVGAWSALVCSFTLLHWVEGANLGIDSLLLTVTGFVVASALSLRSSTAYERYAEGRRYWGQLTLNCQTLGRVIWLHVRNRPGEEKESLLEKLTAMNLLVAYCVALKHKLRFEPYTHYEDLQDLVEHLDTLGKTATESGVFEPKEPNFFKAVGERLGLNFATSNPRKVIKRAREEGVPLGNLPLEILCYIASYIDDKIEETTLPSPGLQTVAWAAITAINDCMVNTERVLNTPLPIAYSIAISQITWVYVLLLPFQLLPRLGWVTIPANMLAAYIILGLLFIGREVENPFGNDVNDLPLELFCENIVEDLQAITSRPRRKAKEWIHSDRNKVLFPHSHSNFHSWVSRPEESITRALRNRPLRSAHVEQSLSRPGSSHTKNPSRPGTTNAHYPSIASPIKTRPTVSESIV
ncbi:uncharacterized protein PG998_011927 [Apiospora kogelbergensis]|uniref:Bestrophin, RFP-TM, chloride channel n=1 Tax=Apiospora kogelbergensis TaxID=1337665 RepID=A0AAW0QL62_9PEZI